MRDYYEILGVGREADEAGLKSAFRKLAMEHHPDRNGGCEDSSARFKEINEAYSVLCDKQKRAAYDRFGHAGVKGANGAGAGFTDVHDIFNEVFGDVFGDMFGRQQQRRPSGPTRGADLRYDLEISLEQAYAGAEVEVKVPAALTCEDCTGSGCAPGASPSACASCATPSSPACAPSCKSLNSRWISRPRLQRSASASPRASTPPAAWTSPAT